MGKSDIKIVITDLDGTLFNSNGALSDKNLEVLHILGSRGVVRVVATGRNLYSAQTALHDNFPIDYLVFSTGAGVMDWKTKEIINKEHLDKNEVREIAQILIEHHVDFTIQKQMPDNHHFSYYVNGNTNRDFFSRLNHYKGFEEAFDFDKIDHSTQILAILKEDVDWFNELSLKFSDIKIVRTTSPLDGKSIWMEIFPKHVSKAFGVNFLLEKCQIGKAESLAIGNDYNDLDFLHDCPNSFVVDNAPNELKKEFKQVLSNDEDGFSEAVSYFFNDLN